MPQGFYDPLSYLRYDNKPYSDWMDKIMQQMLSQQSGNQSQDWLPFVQQILAQNWNRPSEEQLGSSKNWLLNLLGIKDINSNTTTSGSSSSSNPQPQNTTYHYNPETKRYEPVNLDWNPEADRWRLRNDFIAKRESEKSNANADNSDTSELATMGENYFKQWQDYLSRVFSRQHYFNPEEMENMLSKGGAGYRNTAAGDIGGLMNKREYQGAGYGSGPIVRRIGDIKDRLSGELGGMGLEMTELDRKLLEDWKKGYIGPSMDMARMWKELYEMLSSLELTQTADEGSDGGGGGGGGGGGDNRYYPADYDRPSIRYDPFRKYRPGPIDPNSYRPRGTPSGGNKGRVEPPPWKKIPPGLPFYPPGRGPTAQKGFWG